MTSSAALPHSRTRTPGRVDSKAGTYSPLNIGDMVLWLDAAQLVGLSDGDAVASWTDMSGQNNHATQGTSGNRPIYKVNIVNGRPVVRFDGTDDVLVTTSNMPGGGGAISIYAVIYALDNSQRSIIGWGAESDNNFIGFKIGTTQDHLEYYWWANDIDWDANLQVNTWYYVAALFDGVNRSIRMNGTSNTPDTPVGKNTTASTAKIGNAASGDTVFYGDIAEIIVYNRSLISDEITSLEAYFVSKYGI